MFVACLVAYVRQFQNMPIIRVLLYLRRLQDAGLKSFLRYEFANLYLHFNCSIYGHNAVSTTSVTPPKAPLAKAASSKLRERLQALALHKR